MPTGYTADVGDGKIDTLEAFAWECARGMGALILMRDEPHDAPVPERFEPRTEYHDKAIAVARALLAEVVNLTDAECEQRRQIELAAEIEEHTERINQGNAQIARYEAMLRRVEAWECRADGLKGFMAEQLVSSIKFDAPTPERWNAASDPIDGPAWRSAKMEGARKALEYHGAEIAKEVARTEARNAWVAALRASLEAAK